jgi:PhnB protein
MNTSTIKTVQPYLFFDGRCDEAIEFYKETLGAEVARLLRFKDNPEPPNESAGCGPTPPDDKVMHAALRIGNTSVMVSDGRCVGTPNFDGFALSLTAATEADADRLFAALEQGGAVIMPMAKTFFSPRFGMVTDRFGVCWMVIVEA